MPETLLNILEEALDDIKASDVVSINVEGISDVTDNMVIATGSSSRHVKSISDRLMSDAKEKGHRPLGVEGTETGEWVLVDFGDVIVHIMQKTTRDFYELEKLWSMPAAQESVAQGQGMRLV